MGDLVVELYGERVGTLKGTWRTFDFIPEPQAVRRFGLDSPILSVAIPLAVVPTRARKERRQAFFHELLPEGNMLTRMAQEAGLQEQDVIGMLRTYGRDIAGALQIWDPDVPGEPKQPAIEPLTSSDVSGLLAHVGDNPLGNKPVGGKTSLAGVQDKIVLVRTGDGWARAIDGYPSTHILKPASREHPTTIYDEEFGARIARRVGLLDYATWIGSFVETPALVVERYDRSVGAPEGRIHQEDFSQVLGAVGIQKYQRFGGRVSLERVATVLTSLGERASTVRLLRLVVVSTAVGNLDLHAKNLSILHPPDGSLELAPAYDVVPQAHQQNDGEMGLAIDREYRHRELTRAHLVAEGRQWGLRDAEAIVEETLSDVLTAVASEVPDPRAHSSLTDDIATFTKNLIAGRVVGAPQGERRV